MMSYNKYERGRQHLNGGHQRIAYKMEKKSITWWYIDYTDYMVHVKLRHLLYLYFLKRNVSFDTLLVMILDAILNDLLLYKIFPNLWLFYFLFTSYCIFLNVCMYVSMCVYLYTYVSACLYIYQDSPSWYIFINGQTSGSGIQVNSYKSQICLCL